MSTKLFLLVGCFLLCLWLPTELDALFCHRCLALDCKGDHKECQDVRAFIVLNLKKYYYIDDFIQPCVEPADDTVEWRVRETFESPCENTGYSSTSAATCSAGRIQIKSYRGGNSPVPVVSHATVLGCAKELLLSNVRNAKAKTQCDWLRANGTGPVSGTMFHKMEIEHCSDPATLCHDIDFCVHPEESVVKEFKDRHRASARFDYGLVIGIIAFIIVIFAAIIGARVCAFPPPRLSNLPKSSDNTDLIGARPISTRPVPPPRPPRRDETQPMAKHSEV